MKKEGAAWHPLFPLGRSVSLKNVEVIMLNKHNIDEMKKSLPFCMKQTIRILDAMSLFASSIFLQKVKKVYR